MAAHEVVVLGVGVIACVFDLRTRRIPNLLTFGGAAAALVYSFVVHGAAGLLVSAGGWLTGAALFLPFFALGGMGAGDVKLLACFGAWLGPGMALRVGLYAAIAGGVMAIGVALSAGYLRQAFANIGALMVHWGMLKPFPELTLERSRGPRLAYAVPLLAGVAAAIWLQ